MGGDVLRGLHLAQHFGGVTADAVVVDLAQLDLAFRVDDEGAAQGQSLFFNHHVEGAGDGAGGVANERVVHLADGVRGVVPGFVREVRVGADTVDFHAERLESVVVVGQIAEFRRANKGEVGGVEEHD